MKAINSRIVILDRRASGEDRMFYIEAYLGTGYVYINDDLIEGFYLPNWGEGHIVAKTAEAGYELMLLRFKTKSNAAFPAENTNASAFMDKQGMAVFQTIKRMRLGPARPWHPEYIYNRIRGNLG